VDDAAYATATAAKHATTMLQLLPATNFRFFVCARSVISKIDQLFCCDAEDKGCALVE
jgi:hypothetical protein